MNEHVIIVSPSRPGTFEARLEGSETVLCVSSTPLFAAARALLANGAAEPKDVLVMRHAFSWSKGDALRARVGVAAGLSVRETGSRPRLGRWEPFISRGGASGKRFPEGAATPL